jgi:hypothetical protein
MPDFDAIPFDDELLSAYLDDELAPEERARVEEWLAADPRARQLLDELRAVSRAMRELPAATLGADLRESVLRRAERAMLVSGEGASARGLSEVVRRIPFGRSKRAWFWAGAALAAGLMLMVFQQEPERNRDLLGDVALRDRDAVALNETLPQLEVQSREKAKEEVASPPAAVSAPVSVVGREDASGGVGGAGAVMDASTAVNGVAEDLLVVHVNVTPAAIANRVFDAVLVDNQIEMEEPTEDELRSEPSQDVDVVLVEAAPAQISACLAELDADRSNFLGIAVDDEFAANQRARAAERPADDLKQYNFGVVPRQQKVELAPNNNLYYQTVRGQIEIDRKLAGKDDFARQSQSQQAPGYAASQDSVATLRSAAPAAGRLYAEAKQGVARRAVQKLATKAEMLQVLFVLQASEEPASAKPAALPTTSPPAEEGLKIDER